MSPLDLHVLGTPPAFVLSQDQTLSFNPFIRIPSSRLSRSLSELTVVLSCVFSLYRFQGSAPLARSLYIIPNASPFVNTFFEIFSIFFCFYYFPERSIFLQPESRSIYRTFPFLASQSFVFILPRHFPPSQLRIRPGRFRPDRARSSVRG